MTRIDATAPRAGAVPPPPGQDVGHWGMILFCLTEATFFAYLLSSYLYLGVSNLSWPPAGVAKPPLRLPLIMTATLVSSSILLYVAERARDRGQRHRYRLGTAGTIVLGAAFLALMTLEYREKLATMPPGSHAYASIFYTITGFHGSHVAFGLLFLGWTLAADIAGRLPAKKPLAIRNASLYWHFVDGVWLVVLTCLYLSPHWY